MESVVREDQDAGLGDRVGGGGGAEVRVFHSHPGSGAAGAVAKGFVDYGREDRGFGEIFCVDCAALGFSIRCCFDGHNPLDLFPDFCQKGGAGEDVPGRPEGDGCRVRKDGEAVYDFGAGDVVVEGDFCVVCVVAGSC